MFTECSLNILQTRNRGVSTVPDVFSVSSIVVLRSTMMFEIHPLYVSELREKHSICVRMPANVPDVFSVSSIVVMRSTMMFETHPLYVSELREKHSICVRLSANSLSFHEPIATREINIPAFGYSV